MPGLLMEDSMSKNNTNTISAELEDLKQEIKESGELHATRLQIEGEFRKRYKKLLSRMSDEELEEMVSSATEFVNLGPLAEHTANRVAEKVLFNVTDPRWIKEKAFDALVTGLSVVGAAYAAKKMGVFEEDKATENKVSLFLNSSDADEFSPFADTTPSQASPRIGLSRPQPRGSVDHAAS